jgi:hypothetical protein
MIRLHCALYTIPTRRPLWMRIWVRLQIAWLEHRLDCLVDERADYQAVADMPGSEFKLGEQYLANCETQERELKSRIAVLGVLR